ncbi:MAG: methyltransferase domain-containing protein [Pyrinomonadaceae bacterium]|jgi:2-polyprenyl-3-methyl-5-hydroxy-6-metoxy-1,4-benzoquinol methylase|nr:methyltransferase domain-containing protein [Pyrinomonadaceae bacterium]
MSTDTYKEFTWRSSGPGNGETGFELVKKFLTLVTRLENVRRICDLGCGNGYLAGRLAALGYEVTGVDASESGIEIAQESYSKPQFLRSLINSFLSENTGLRDFDLVISSDVIEHLYRPADLLEAATPLLKERGQILIGTPYHGYLKNLALSLTGKMDSHFCVLEDGGHIKFFSVKTLSALVQMHGFNEPQFSFYGRAPLLWMNMICHARKR